MVAKPSDARTDPVTCGPFAFNCLTILSATHERLLRRNGRGPPAHAIVNFSPVWPDPRLGASKVRLRLTDLSAAWAARSYAWISSLEILCLERPRSRSALLAP